MPRILDLENVIYNFIEKFVNVAMRTNAWFTNIFIYFYNKNILEYAQFLVTSSRLMIFHIEGHSSAYESSVQKTFLFIYFGALNKILFKNKASKF